MKAAGGVFIYALSILDAYKIARVKWEKWRYAATKKDDSGSAGAPLH